MKQLITLAMMLNLVIAGASAQSTNVKMRFSDTGAASVINLNQPNTHTAEENVAGSGTLGQFTLRNVSAIANAPQASANCAGIYFPRVAGAGVLRFQDGSLMKVYLIQGGDCIDLVHMVGNCTLTLQVAGGTGRFQGASGVLTYTEMAQPVIADASNSPVFFTESGEITGTISGVGAEAPSSN